MTEKEGLLKFNLSYTASPPLPYEAVRALCAWRRIMVDTGLIGQSPDRYEGLGFGNISCRLAPTATPAKAMFAVSGTQTGGLAELDARHIAIVLACDPARNHLSAAGPVRPSSEAMTHAAVYLEEETAAAVIHAHSPHLWHAAGKLALPVTDAAVAYGTPAMARAVQSQVQKIQQARKPPLLIMGGHEDGVLAFGQTLDTAATVLLRYLAKAYALN